MSAAAANQPASTLASPRATKDVLARHGLATKKALGQHFLIDDNVIAKILELAAIRADDTVLEVGPGIGTLTVTLLPACARVVAIERDRDLLPVLAETCAQDSEKLALIEADALKVGQDDIARAAGTGQPGIATDPVSNGGGTIQAVRDAQGTQGARGKASLPRLLVANLPYAVAATIVLDFFERFDFLQEAVVMVQSEVADRMAANPGSKDYGAYTVKLRLQASICSRFQVSPQCFFPPPRVESAVVRLVRERPDFEGAPASDALLQAAAQAADAAFTQRRKTIKNSMAAYYASRGHDKAAVDAVLAQAGIAPAVRGETLGQDDFLRLAKALIANGLA